MVETVEIEVSDPVAMMLGELRDKHGDEVVNADLRQAVEQATWAGYQSTE